MNHHHASDAKTFTAYFLAPCLMFMAPLAGNWGFLAFYLISLAITIELTYQGFIRQSRFALSHKHPVSNSVLNGLMIILPFISLLTFGLSFALPVLLAIHAFSVIRSPAPAETGLPPFHDPAYRYIAWAVLYCIGLGGYIVKTVIFAA